MGTYKNGITGPFSGKIGPVVGSSWKGIDYMRSLPRRTNRPPTDKQKAQRMKMALAIGFLSPISELVNIGFSSEAIKTSGFNVATSSFISNAITGTYPHLDVDYSRVLISSGNLTGPWNTTISSTLPGMVTISWTDNSGSGTAKSTDTAVILVFNRTKAKYYYKMPGKQRNSKQDIISFPPNYSGDTLEIWITFISATNKNISTSIHAGNITVS